ncbi:four-carbon acid sugar kinase family protein [Paracoccus aestuariivivens]|uniref:Four-carbon acid sugar kinase family protein n=1 Tax=Paracoccus aestuariivivens TaxID=1820333 RepID=A0A6L6J7F1_9RHOB|nr:four-carbon acid sugar kinase family protein [Paracoccus aestuariivivens]MTH77870.1 four-carbon acid sugar kinase family protein [Paracoccus aestuariivivens]
MTKPSLAIIADDLTGALDSAAPFAGRGLSVVVALGPEQIVHALATKPDVIAVTTCSREIPQRDAALAVRKTMAALPEVRIFKKVDSRLKGNIAAELAEIPFHHALMAPAIPEFGRIVADGRVTGFGVAEPIPVTASLGKFSEAASIPDISTTDQMHDALRKSDADLLIGARGLAEALAIQMTGRPESVYATLPGPDAIFVIGSRDPITLAQAERLAEGQGFLHVAAPNGEVPCPIPEAHRLLIQLLPAARAEPGKIVGARFAKAVAHLVKAGTGTALLTGGATAEAILRECAIPFLTVRGECLPGLVASDAGGLTVVTKSGGFGDKDSLVKLAAMIGKGN